MIPKRIARATRQLGPPPGAEGEVSRLWIRIGREGDENGPICCESSWEPTPEKLEQLQQGGSVILRVMGGQPPVALYVEPAEPEEESKG